MGIRVINPNTTTSVTDLIGWCAPPGTTLAAVTSTTGPAAIESHYEAATALATDDSEAIVPGCAGMADRRARLPRAIGVPVVGGVSAATLTVRSRPRKSGRGEFATSLPKPDTGLLAGFGTPGAAL